MNLWTNVFVETKIVNYCTPVMTQHVSLQPYLLYQGVPPSSWSNEGKRSVSVQPRMGQRVLESRKRSNSRLPSTRQPLELSNLVHSKSTTNCSQEFKFLNSSDNMAWGSLVDISMEKEDEKKITKEMIQREMYGSRESGIYSESSNQDYSSPDSSRSRFDRHQDSRRSKRSIKKTNVRSYSQPVGSKRYI